MTLDQKEQSEATIIIFSTIFSDHLLNCPLLSCRSFDRKGCTLTVQKVIFDNYTGSCIKSDMATELGKVSIL